MHFKINCLECRALLFLFDLNCNFMAKFDKISVRQPFDYTTLPLLGYRKFNCRVGLKWTARNIKTAQISSRRGYWFLCCHSSRFGLSDWLRASRDYYLTNRVVLLVSNNYRIEKSMKKTIEKYISLNQFFFSFLFLCFLSIY